MRHPSGPRFHARDRARLAGLETSASQAPTWRGWVLGVLSCAFLAAVIPHIDLVIRCTRLTLNLLPASSMVLLLVLILLFNLGLGRWSARLRLTRQDLALVFCMTMLVNSLPGVGFMNYLINGQMGLSYFATPENQWEQVLQPHIPEALAARDPQDPNSKEPRPAEWFYSGVPRTAATPWPALEALARILAPPYLRWCLALVLLFGVFFAVSVLLHRQWSDRERLPFPLAQVPQSMLGGLFGGDAEQPFVTSRLFWLGVAVTFLLHSWNACGNYASNWAPIPLKNDLASYLTETPWKYLRPMNCHIFPSVIAFMYLVSLEVSFSLWFFYLVVLKVGVVIAVGGFGLGEDGWYFNSGSEGTRGIFQNQGTGALLVMALASLFWARRALWSSLRQALGLGAREPDEDFSPRAVWVALLLCLGGFIAWLMWYGLAWKWAVLLPLLLLLVAVGMARLVSEGGVLFAKGAAPAGLIGTVFTPVDLGTRSYVMAGLCSKVFDFDTFRMNPLTYLMSALHLGTLARLRMKPLLVGLAAALVITFAVSFFSYHYTCYMNPGGARTLGWAFYWSEGFYKDLATKVKQAETYEKRRDELAQASREVPAAQVPEAAKTDWIRLEWLGLGVALMATFLFLRTRLFWWPHPIGYVMWISPQPIYQMWFSYLIGWLIKTLVLKFGGQRAFLNGRRFFVGLILGEALATLFWIVVAWLTGFSGGYAIEYN